MADWLERAATELGVDAPDEQAQQRILDAARDVAHGVERKLTPIATFLVGAAVERRAAAGEERSAAFTAALSDLERAIDADHA